MKPMRVSTALEARGRLDMDRYNGSIHKNINNCFHIFRTSTIFYVQIFNRNFRLTKTLKKATL